MTSYENKELVGTTGHAWKSWSASYARAPKKRYISTQSPRVSSAQILHGTLKFAKISIELKAFVSGLLLFFNQGKERR